MWTDKVVVLRDLSPADWLASRVTVGAHGILPRGYAAYARVLHPVEFDDGGEPVTWDHVARVVGSHTGPDVPWHALIRSPASHWWTSELWPEGEPRRGNLHPTHLVRLCHALAAHTGAADDCFFALWDGWGHVKGGAARTELTTGGGRPLEPLMTAQELESPRLHLPGRDYLLLRGPLSAVEELVRHDGPASRETQSPSLFWPADGAWCVTTEIDADSTLVAGSEEAVESVLTQSGVEAVRLDPGLVHG